MGLTFGVGRLEDGLFLPAESFQFSTSTGRVISFRLDFNKG